MAQDQPFRVGTWSCELFNYQFQPIFNLARLHLWQVAFYLHGVMRDADDLDDLVADQHVDKDVSGLSSLPFVVSKRQ